MAHVFINVPYAPVRPKEDIVCLSLLLSTLCFDIGWFTETRSHHFSLAAQKPPDLPVSTFTQPGYPVSPQICLSPPLPRG